MALHPYRTGLFFVTEGTCPCCRVYGGIYMCTYLGARWLCAKKAVPNTGGFAISSSGVGGCAGGDWGRIYGCSVCPRLVVTVTNAALPNVSVSRYNN